MCSQKAIRATPAGSVDAVWSLSEFVSLCPVLLARAAAAASAARHPRPAGGAYLPELRLRLGDFRSEERAFGHTELAGHFPPFKTQSRAECLPALRPLVGDMVGLSVFHEHGAGLDEVEGHAVGAALETERLHPLEMAGTGPVVVLPAAEHLLDKSRGEVILRVERADERGRHKAPVLRRGVQENRKALVRPPLVLRRDAEHHILVALTPVCGKTLSEPLRPLGEKEEEYVRALPDDLPRLAPPLVGLLDEEVRRKAHVQGRAWFYAETAVTPALDGQVEVLRAEDARGVDASSGVEEVHIAVLAAFADLAAAVPGVPDDHPCRFKLTAIFRDLDDYSLRSLETGASAGNDILGRTTGLSPHTGHLLGLRVTSMILVCCGIL